MGAVGAIVVLPVGPSLIITHFRCRWDGVTGPVVQGSGIVFLDPLRVRISNRGSSRVVVLASLRLRALTPARRLLGVPRCVVIAVIASTGIILVVSLPAALRVNLRGTLSRFALTRKASVLASLGPALVRDSPAAPPAPTPTNVGFTVSPIGGVADIVLFNLNWLVRGCFLAKK